MKIRMLTSMAGPDVSLQPGDELDVSAEVGTAWVQAGIAQAVEQTIEARVTRPASNTSRKRGSNA